MKYGASPLSGSETMKAVEQKTDYLTVGRDPSDRVNAYLQTTGAKTSKAALKTGHFIRTRNTMYELPASATAVTQDYRQEAVVGISQPAGVWFDEPVVEMCISSKRYEQEMTLLHLPRKEPAYQAEEVDEDAFVKLSESFQR